MSFEEKEALFAWVLAQAIREDNLADVPAVLAGMPPCISRWGEESVTPNGVPMGLVLKNESATYPSGHVESWRGNRTLRFPNGETWRFIGVGSTCEGGDPLACSNGRIRRIRVA